MKKLIALLMALSMLFVLVACSAPCTAHTDEDHDQKCDICGVNVECTEHIDENGDYACDYCDADQTPESVKLTSGIASQLAGAKSARIELDYSHFEEVSEWYDYVDENDEYATAEDKYADGVKAKVYITLAKSGNFVNIQVESDIVYYDDELDKWEESAGKILEAVVIDGVAYQAFDGGYFAGFDMGLAEDVELLTNLFEGIEPTEEEIDKLYKLFGEQVITSFNILENKGSAYINFKAIIENLTAYFNELDFETDTIGKVADDLLALVAPDLTAEEFLTELERVGALTVNEALAELDAWLTEEYDTTLQALYDSIVDDERIAIFIGNFYSYMSEMEGIEFTEEEKAAAVESTLASIKVNFAELITEAGIGEIPLYDIVLMLVMEATGATPTEDTPTLTGLVATANQMLAMTISEFETQIDLPIISSFKETLNSQDIEVFDAKLDLNFKNLFQIDSIVGSINYEGTSASESYVEGKQDIEYSKTSINVKIYDISTNEVTLTVPEKSLVFPIESYLHASDEDTFGAEYMEISSYGNDEFGLYLYLTTENGTMSVYADFSEIERLASTTLTISAEDIRFLSENNEWFYPEDDTDLEIEYDPTTETFVIVTFPAYIYPHSNAPTAINEIGFGLGTDNSDEFDIDPTLNIYFDRLGTSDGSISFTNMMIGYEFDYTLDSNGNMVCTIVGVDSSPGVLVNANGVGFMGATYAAEDLDAFFGSDRSFTIYLTKDGMVCIDDLPEIPAEYFK